VLCVCVRCGAAPLPRWSAGSFTRVHWVAVPAAMRARRLNQNFYFLGQTISGVILFVFTSSVDWEMSSMVTSQSRWVGPPFLPLN
jgi:hypothetical protein